MSGRDDENSKNSSCKNSDEDDYDSQQQEEQEENNYNNNNSNNEGNPNYGKKRKFADLSPKEFWKEKKKERRERVKERKKNEKEEKQREWDSLTPEQQEEMKKAMFEKTEQRTKEQAEFEVASKKNFFSSETPTIVFDLQFSNTMIERDVKSTINQLKISYASMRHQAFGLRPAFYSGGGDGGKGKQQQEQEQEEQEGEKEREEGEQQNQNQNQQQGKQNKKKKKKKQEDEKRVSGTDVLEQLSVFEGFKKFPPPFVNDSVASLDHETTYYLTADSPNVIWDLQPGNNYIIGAFADRNSLKNATYDFATRSKMKTARLPLNECLEKIGNKCKVLTINAVVDILLRVMKYDKQDWKRAIVETLPTRRDNNNNTPATAASATSCNNQQQEEEEEEGEEQGNDNLPSRRERSK